MTFQEALTLFSIVINTMSGATVTVSVKKRWHKKSPRISYYPVLLNCPQYDLSVWENSKIRWKYSPICVKCESEVLVLWTLKSLVQIPTNISGTVYSIWYELSKKVWLREVILPYIAVFQNIFFRIRSDHASIQSDHASLRVSNALLSRSFSTIPCSLWIFAVRFVIELNFREMYFQIKGTVHDKYVYWNFPIVWILGPTLAPNLPL